MLSLDEKTFFDVSNETLSIIQVKSWDNFSTHFLTWIFLLLENFKTQIPESPR